MTVSPDPRQQQTDEDAEHEYDQQRHENNESNCAHSTPSRFEFNQRRAGFFKLAIVQQGPEKKYGKIARME
jgi:hypothetical protein